MKNDSEAEKTVSVDYKKYINDYLHSCVKKEFGLEIFFGEEYEIMQNIVSNKSMIVPTFSDSIIENPKLHAFLKAHIAHLNKEMFASEIS
ncbi:hypothetical protein [Chryseobacterium sp. C3]|uniref:hypothetical protein n=1 Tax=Chryseobacterium sp. C3 TaxID=2761532 RepID=UPI0016293A40|nr:hypothetical protein [Chryseobacterium sp. C3]